MFNLSKLWGSLQNRPLIQHFAFATIDKNDDEQVRNNTETTVKSVKADQPKSTYVFTNGGVYAAPQKKQQ